MVRERILPAFDIRYSSSEITDFVRDCIAGCQDQYRNVAVLGSEAAKNLTAIQRGQHEIKNHQIVVVCCCKIESRLAVRCDINNKTFFRQAPSDGTGHLGLVLHQQDAHRFSARQYIAVGLEALAKSDEKLFRKRGVEVNPLFPAILNDFSSELHGGLM